MKDNIAKGITDLQQQEKQSQMGGYETQKPLVAIVILNWNGKKYLRQFLPSVLKSTYENKRIIVADNASTDDSVEFLKNQYPQVQLIPLSRNEGFAKGYNLALQQVEADYYVLLNSDVEVMPGWIEPVVALLERNGTIAACQPKILSFLDKWQFEYAGASGGWLDRFGYPFSRGRVFDVCETDRGQYNMAEPCFWASGAAFFVRPEVFKQMGGFDPYFFAHQEEIDLCWRMQLAGHQVYVQPLSVVYHVGGGTLPKGNSLKTFLNFRNNLIMLYKNLNGLTLIYTIWVRLFLDALAAWKGLLSGDGGYFLAIASSHMHFFKWILWHQKDSIFPQKSTIRPKGWYPGLLVWDYFVKNRRTFSEILANKSK
jgi:GT2 family glycosyltransferase